MVQHLEKIFSQKVSRGPLENWPKLADRISSLLCRHRGGGGGTISIPALHPPADPAAPLSPAHASVSHLSSRTRIVRRIIDSTPALVVQTLCYDRQPEELDAWIEEVLWPFMEDVGTNSLAPRPSVQEPLIWLQAVVLELAEVSRLKVCRTETRAVPKEIDRFRSKIEGHP